ncbi:MAG: GNAT family N-acetyltransferase [Betaproteobacteria bacterium]|nr:GNAT family N-acetyltransferase [Betaproteobacteria bacterium]
MLQIRFIEDLAGLPSAQWDALAGDNPFLRHAFLEALQATGCAVPETGWGTSFATAWEADRLVGAMPLYFKSHSWGEFVFDWAWADAYQRNGMRYYPKLVSSVPFTPVTGPRILAHSPEVRSALLNAVLELAAETGASSLHILFPTEAEARAIQTQGLMLRQGVQLHWHNPGYASFADYLASLRRDKRKKVQQERRRVRDAGIRFERLTGERIEPAHWEHFMRCYGRTHEQFNSPQTLNLEFFLRAAATMADNILLVIAFRDDVPIASAVNFYNRDALYGRSWGTLEYHSGLHFETCYYQTIEFCIENRIALFEGGAQGEHKLARGFLPTVTWSAHWLAEPRFARAVDDFLQREAGGIARYVDELNESNPFKSSWQPAVE